MLSVGLSLLCGGFTPGRCVLNRTEGMFRVAFCDEDLSERVW